MEVFVSLVQRSQWSRKQGRQLRVSRTEILHRDSRTEEKVVSEGGRGNRLGKCNLIAD